MSVVEFGDEFISGGVRQGPNDRAVRRGQGQSVLCSWGKLGVDTRLLQGERVGDASDTETVIASIS